MSGTDRETDPVQVIHVLVMAPSWLGHGHAAALQDVRRDLLQVDFVLRVISMLGSSEANDWDNTMVVRFSGPVDGKRLLQRLVDLTFTHHDGSDLGENRIVEKTVAGKACFAVQPQHGREIDLAYIADDRTLIFPGSSTTPAKLAAREPTGVLAQRLCELDFDHDLTFVVAMPPDRDSVKNGLLKVVHGDSPPHGLLPKLPELVKLGTLCLDLTREPLLEVVLEADNANGAEKLRALVEAWVAFDEDRARRVVRIHERGRERSVGPRRDGRRAVTQRHAPGLQRNPRDADC